MPAPIAGSSSDIHNVAEGGGSEHHPIIRPVLADDADSKAESPLHRFLFRATKFESKYNPLFTSIHAHTQPHRKPARTHPFCSVRRRSSFLHSMLKKKRHYPLPPPLPFLSNCYSVLVAQTSHSRPLRTHRTAEALSRMMLCCAAGTTLIDNETSVNNTFLTRFTPLTVLSLPALVPCLALIRPARHCVRGEHISSTHCTRYKSSQLCIPT